MPDIEALFKKKEVKVVVKEEKEAKKIEELQLLDPRRENNCGIKMSKIKVETDIVIQGLLALEPERFLPAGHDYSIDEKKDIVEILRDCSPHADERETLRNFDGDADHISKVDKFFLRLLEVQGNLETRLKCMMLMLTFDQRHFVACQHAREKLDACTRIKKSIEEGGKLLYICTFVLELGNFLNFGNRRFGDAAGYKLDSLLKLADSKAPNAPEGQKFTLAHYVVKHCRENAPAAMHILMELECVASAFAYPLDQLTADVAKINADVTFITRSASSAPKDIEADKMGEILTAVRCAFFPYWPQSSSPLRTRDSIQYSDLTLVRGAWCVVRGAWFVMYSTEPIVKKWLVSFKDWSTTSRSR